MFTHVIVLTSGCNPVVNPAQAMHIQSQNKNEPDEDDAQSA